MTFKDLSWLERASFRSLYEQPTKLYKLSPTKLQESHYRDKEITKIIDFF